MHAAGGGGVIHQPSALENARLLYQMHTDLQNRSSFPPAATPVVSGASAPPMEIGYHATGVPPQHFNPDAVYEQQHWAMLPPGWQRVCDVEGGMLDGNACSLYMHY